MTFLLDWAQSGTRQYTFEVNQKSDINPPYFIDTTNRPIQLNDGYLKFCLLYETDQICDMGGSFCYPL